LLIIRLSRAIILFNHLRLVLYQVRNLLFLIYQLGIKTRNIGLGRCRWMGSSKVEWVVRICLDRLRFRAIARWRGKKAFLIC
jgi:hypothetical protein